ncbi:MarR family winged helix-turn-helix transcriptional regulator [uncultured Clostridium sp.]|uniref:MarR family winged helix-turn-helix transcriptional regulator n=1 Tax=uncultured Clostridium sp. TaxID=59620 RepID=UPI0025F9A4C8|nr:MarR family transcriptional regulator [uncultured Clostridium sp.]
MQINIGIIRRCEQSFLRDRLRTCRLKPVDSVVLLALSRHGQCNQDTLCSIVNIDKGRMARVMERLEERSLIRRLVNPDNKREKLIEMTEEGEKMLEVINSFSREWNERCFAGFTENEKQEYQSYLERIARNALAGKENLEND